MKTSTSTAPGELFPPTAQSGFRPRLLRDGRPIATDTGCGSARGVGLGWMTPPGDSLLSTTAAGSMPDIGHGCPDRFTFVPSMLRRWSPGLAAPAWQADFPWVMVMAGVREATGD